MVNEGREIAKFQRVSSINSAGELMVNAGRYSRGAVIAAFEMMGGLETFATWAQDNKGEFYTKLFGKTIGREMETKSSDSVEEYLKILDGEYSETQDVVETVRPSESPPPITGMARKLADIATTYAKAHPIT